jgi:hypothetical protein
MLDYYVNLRKQAGSSAQTMTILQKDINKIKQWQKDNPSRIRVPL